MFAIIGKWQVDEALDSEQLTHIATTVRQQPGFVRGYWGQEVDSVAFAHAVVLLDDEASAQKMAEGVKVAIPSATLRVVRVLADAWAERASSHRPRDQRLAPVRLAAGVVSQPPLRQRPESNSVEIWSMTDMDFPAPSEGFVLTHFLVVADQDLSRRWYEQVLGAKTVLERDPVIMKVANSWIILNVGGGPTADKPEVTLETPPDPRRTSAFLNIRVADIASAYQQWRAAGAEFLTEPQDRGAEIRCYMRDPDGHLIEVGQSTGVRG